MRPLLLLLALAAPLVAREIPIADPAALAKALKSAQPGDELVLADGEWRDAKLVFTGRGVDENPITLKAATPGKVILTGKSTLNISGEYLAVEDLLFRDPDPSLSDVIQFRKDSKQLAKHCRMTNCAVVSTLKADGTPESRWVGLYGTQNRVNRCTFQGKTGAGAMFVVWLDQGSEGGHLIDHNYFGPRERLGKNGGETIRIGDSQTSMLRGGCLVENNLFEKCNGEVECISNKSCENIYRSNTFLEVSGTLTLRHGNGCVVERNVFLGNRAKGTGGVRIIGEDHIVRHNYFEKLTGDGTRAAISFMLGIPNSPANRYFQVQRAQLEDNTIVDCEHPIVIGVGDDEKATLTPAKTVIRGNQVSSPKRAIVQALCALDGITWQENVFAGESSGIPETAGVKMGAPKITPLPPIARQEVGTAW